MDGLEKLCSSRNLVAYLLSGHIHVLFPICIVPKDAPIIFPALAVPEGISIRLRIVNVAAIGAGYVLESKRPMAPPEAFSTISNSEMGLLHLV
jgi:hypothetical protein